MKAKDKIAKLAEQRSDLQAEFEVEAAKAARLSDAALEGEGRSLTADEKTKLEGHNKRAKELKDQIADLDSEIEIWEERVANDALANKAGERRVKTDPAPDAPKPEPRIENAWGAAFRGAKGFGPNIAVARPNAFDAGMWICGQLGQRHEHLRAKAREHIEARGLGYDMRAMNSTTNTAGGYLIPDVLNSAIINLKEERGVFRQNANVVTMSSDTESWPRRTAGTTVYYVGENTAPTESEPTVDQVNLNARIAAQLTRIPDSLSEDAIIDVAGFVADEMAYGFANAEDSAGFLGDGTSTYGGIVGLTKLNDGSHDGSLYTAAAGNTAFSTLDLVDFEGALGQLPQYALEDAAWYISRVGFYSSMVNLMNAAGGNTNDNIGGGTGMQFLGLPVRISQVLNSTTAADVSAVKCYVGSLRQTAMLGDRRVMTMRVLNERYADSMQIGIIGSQRFDINVHEAGDATNAGSLVALKTPGA